FIARHEDKLADNPRMRMPYRTWAKQSPQAQRATRAQAATFLDGLDQDGPPYDVHPGGDAHAEAP
ncbi:MAG TPA: hypothetical protein VF695_11900, partial [Sphingomonas sp.]